MSVLINMLIIFYLLFVKMIMGKEQMMMVISGKSVSTVRVRHLLLQVPFFNRLYITLIEIYRDWDYGYGYGLKISMPYCIKYYVYSRITLTTIPTFLLIVFLLNWRTQINYDPYKTCWFFYYEFIQKTIIENKYYFLI